MKIFLKYLFEVLFLYDILWIRVVFFFILFDKVDYNLNKVYSDDVEKLNSFELVRLVFEVVEVFMLIFGVF